MPSKSSGPLSTTRGIGIRGSVELQSIASFHNENDLQMRRKLHKNNLLNSLF